jgi:hypothetical protein
MAAAAFPMLTAKLPSATGPSLSVVRHTAAPKFRRRQRCVQLPIPTGIDLTSVSGQVVMLLIDDSGSMFHPEADRQGLRYIAAESVVNLLRRIDVPALGIVHWGSYCPADLLLRPTTPHDIRRLDIALRMPPSPLGGTDLSEALRFAHSVAQEDMPGLVPNYLVITDGLESVGRRLENELSELPPRSVRVLLVDRAGKCGNRVEQQWRDLPLSIFLRLDTDDPDDWAWAAAVAVFANMTIKYPELPHPSSRKYLR